MTSYITDKPAVHRYNYKKIPTLAVHELTNCTTNKPAVLDSNI